MEARVSLHDMTQDLDSSLVFEPGQASVLKFTLQCQGCEHSVDYNEVNEHTRRQVTLIFS